MKKFVYLFSCVVILLTVGACQPKKAEAFPPQCKGEVPKVPNIEINVDVCNNSTMECRDGIIMFSPKCTRLGWGYRPSINNVDPAKEISFTIPVNSKVFFNPTFLYGAPDENNPKGQFNNTFISVWINNQKWFISENGLLSNDDNNIVQAGSIMTIKNEQGFDHLPTMTKGWVKNLLSLVEAIVIIQ